MNNGINEHATIRPNLETCYRGYREVAAANGVLLIDHYANWVTLYDSETTHAAWKSCMPDGVHPNDLGAEKVIVPEIQRNLMAEVPEP